jgi:hypothetical protein
VSALEGTAPTSTVELTGEDAVRAGDRSRVFRAR